MQGVRPVILLVNDPPPVPFVVLELEVVGAGEVFQHTPCAVTAEAQVPVTLPPEEAVVDVIAEIDVVPTDGVTAPVVNGISAP